MIDFIIVLVAIGIIAYGVYHRYKLKKNNISPCASCSGCASMKSIDDCKDSPNL